MMKTQQMVEFISLWSMLDQVVLSGQQDTIRWKWTADGCYSSRSAYQAQFIETYCSFDSKSIWSAKVEDKDRFFAWFADTMQASHSRPSNNKELAM
jgi:hypothetical protein